VKRFSVTFTAVLFPYYYKHQLLLSRKMGKVCGRG